MKNQKFSNFSKRIILFLSLTLILTNCETNEEIQISEEYMNSDDHSIKEMNLSDFFKSDSYQIVSNTLNSLKRNDTNPISKSSSQKLALEYVGTKVLIASVQGQKTYSIPVRDANDKNRDHNLNLLIKETDLGSSTFLVKYPNDGGAITMQAITRTSPMSHH